VGFTLQFIEHLQMKKYLLCLLLLSFGIQPVFAQRSYNILDWKSHTTLYHYVIHQLHRQYASRDSALKKALQTNTLAGYQTVCRKRYFKLLGGFPAKTPLHPQVTGTVQEKGYRIEKVVYESFPHHHVTANLYIPDGRGPFPGILFFCGHEATAKATTTYQQTSILLAKHGFVVLTIDPISQGERYQFTGPTGHPLTRGGTTAHTLLASGSNLVGTSVVAYQLWDNERGLDYLCSLKEVDTSRLGCIGNSGGGTQAAYFIPYDPRIKAAAVCSYVTRRERTLELLGPQDGCQWLPGESGAGLDISDYLIMFAPKPVLILAGRYGFVDFSGTRDVYGELKEVYRHLHQPEKVGLFAYDDGHGIQIPKQEAAVRWFCHWFFHDNRPIGETDVHTLPEAALQVTKSGQVNSAFKDEATIQTHNLSLADSWKQPRRQLLETSSPEAYRKMIRKVLAIGPSTPVLDTQQMGTLQKDGYQFQKLILRRKGQPPLPCLLAYAPGNRKEQKLMILLSAKGKKSVLQNDSLISAYAARGDALLVADLRGMGETSDEPAFNDKKYDNSEYRVAMLSLFIGHPLPGQRTEDIFTLLNYCKSDPHLKSLPVTIRASGVAAEPALLAAALDTRIDALQLVHTVPSFYTLLDHPMMQDQYAYIIPDVLRYFDLAGLVKFVGKNRVKYLD
jgi:cephalosporin-C deacetylase-like acetyl esterase